MHATEVHWPSNIFWGGGFIFKVKTVKLPHNKSLALNTNCPFIFFNLFSHNYEGVMYKLSLDLLRYVLYIFGSTALFHLFLILILLTCMSIHKALLCL